jgi:hypothetical protein
VDNILRLPSLLPTVTLLFSNAFPFVWLSLLLVIAIHALEVVTVIGPSTIIPNYEYTYLSPDQASSLDLSQGDVWSADVNREGYIQPSAYWNGLVQNVMMSNSPISITAPDDCFPGCSYNVQYSAPVLKCQDLSPPNITTSSDTILYNGTSSLWNSVGIVNALPALTEDPSNHTYTIHIEWQSYAATNTSNGIQGVECQFFDGQYNTSIFYDGNVGLAPIANSTVISRTTPLVGPMANDPGCSPTPDLNQPCWIMATNYRATVEAFAQLLVGEINVEDGGTFSFVGSPGMLPLFNISTMITPSRPTWTFDLEPNLNLSSTLENMFSNVAASLMSARNDTQNVSVTFFGNTVWEYDLNLIWAIYGPTLLVFGLFAAHGLWCIMQDGTVESTFMNFLVSTRGEDFGRAVTNAGDIDAMKGIVVTYAKSGGFEVVADSTSKMVA